MAVGQQFGAHPNFRFVVKIDDINQAAFLECKLPDVTIETLEIQEGGQNEYVHKVPVRAKTGSITLRHGVTRDGKLLKWYMQVLGGNIQTAMRTIEVAMYGVDQKPLTSWIFNNAYPVKWSGPMLKTSDSAVAIDEIEIVHHGFSFEAR